MLFGVTFYNIEVHRHRAFEMYKVVLFTYLYCFAEEYTYEHGVNRCNCNPNPVFIFIFIFIYLLDARLISLLQYEFNQVGCSPLTGVSNLDILDTPTR